MKTSTKFVLNRNDQEYYYVEKSLYGEKYHVYIENKNFLLCNDHNFHAIYGNDEKMSLDKFIGKALLELLSGYLNNEACYIASEKFQKVLEKIMTLKNKKNPDLGSLKKEFLEAMDIYNKLNINAENIEIPYDENYITIMESKSDEKVLDDSKTSHISSITRLNREYSSSLEHKEIVRTKKYDKAA